MVLFHAGYLFSVPVGGVAIAHGRSGYRHRKEVSVPVRGVSCNRGYSISEEAMERILDITDVKRKDQDFANAREVRNILNQVMICQNLRCMDAEDKKLEIVDVNTKYSK